MSGDFRDPALAIAVLPTIDSDVAAKIVEDLALALVDREEELRAVRDVLSASLEHSHTLHVEIVRLCDQYHRLLAEYRRLRVQMLRNAEAA